MTSSVNININGEMIGRIDSLAWLGRDDHSIAPKPGALGTPDEGVRPYM